MMRVRAHFEIARELVDAQITLFPLGAMTTDAVFFQESVIRFRCEDSTGKGKASSERDGE